MKEEIKHKNAMKKGNRSLQKTLDDGQKIEEQEGGWGKILLQTLRFCRPFNWLRLFEVGRCWRETL